MKARRRQLEQCRQRDQHDQDDHGDLKDRANDLDPEDRPRGQFANVRTRSGRDRHG